MFADVITNGDVGCMDCSFVQSIRLISPPTSIVVTFFIRANLVERHSPLTTPLEIQMYVNPTTSLVGFCFQPSTPVNIGCIGDACQHTDSMASTLASKD